jgi:hypothetical protein
MQTGLAPTTVTAMMAGDGIPHRASWPRHSIESYHLPQGNLGADPMLALRETTGSRYLQALVRERLVKSTPSSRRSPC